MKKESKAQGEGAQNTLPKLKSQPAGPDTMPAGFTSGDVFFNPDTTPAPFTNTQLEDSAPQAPHPILHSKTAKDFTAQVAPKPAPKLVPPPPPAIPNQSTLPFLAQKPPTVAPPKLVLRPHLSRSLRRPLGIRVHRPQNLNPTPSRPLISTPKSRKKRIPRTRVMSNHRRKRLRRIQPRKSR